MKLTKEQSEDIKNISHIASCYPSSKLTQHSGSLEKVCEINNIDEKKEPGKKIAATTKNTKVVASEVQVAEGTTVETVDIKVKVAGPGA